MYSLQKISGQKNFSKITDITWLNQSDVNMFLLVWGIYRWKPCNGRVRILTDSARKRNRKEALANYNKTRINIGHQHNLWWKIKVITKLPNSEQIYVFACLFVCLVVFNATFKVQYFSYIVAVSFIGGGNRRTRRKPPTWCLWFCWYFFVQIFFARSKNIN
jgi:hypothetical protein